MANIEGQLTLEGLDGSVQVEPFFVDQVAGNYASFYSTANNFVVSKTDSYITDLLFATAPTTTGITLMVNGRDTGITYLTAAKTAAINNRMPSKPGIGEGASIQLLQRA